MLRLSIVIPVPGEPRQFEDTLVSVLENLPADCEVVVAFNRPYDDPYQLDGEVQFVHATDRQGLAPLINSALAVCRAPVVHLLGCGVAVDPGWADAALPLLADPTVAAVAAVMMDRDKPGRIASTGTQLTAGGRIRHVARGKKADHVRAWPVPQAPHLAGAFYCRSALAALGGFREGVGDDYIAIDAAMRLARCGYRCVLAPDCRLTLDGSAATTISAWQRGWHSERLFWRWLPERSWWSVASHAMHCGGQLLASPVRPSNLLELLARGAALLTAPGQVAQGRGVPRQSLDDLGCDAAPAAAEHRRGAA